jgi:hypothetical protein
MTQVMGLDDGCHLHFESVLLYKHVGEYAIEIPPETGSRRLANLT